MIAALASTTKAFLYVGAIALLAIPLLAGARVWYQYVHDHTYHGARGLLVLVTVTASYLYLVSGLMIKDIMGPDYTTRRFVTIYVDVGVGVLALLWSATYHHPLRRALVVFSAVALIAWVYLAVVSATA